MRISLPYAHKHLIRSLCGRLTRHLMRLLMRVAYAAPSGLAQSAPAARRTPCIICAFRSHAKTFSILKPRSCLGQGVSESFECLRKERERIKHLNLAFDLQMMRERPAHVITHVSRRLIAG